MGWCSATEIFDLVVEPLLEGEVTDKDKKVIGELIIALEGNDWDCQQDSQYWYHPIVKQIYKELRKQKRVI